uniref:Uncharacterized protein n=1 Tax=Aegilops tauschii subsp. strangulata TaxID=200361 RepID=A0A453BJJ8_AEGTS
MFMPRNSGSPVKQEQQDSTTMMDCVATQFLSLCKSFGANLAARFCLEYTLSWIVSQGQTLTSWQHVEYW